MSSYLDYFKGKEDFEAGEVRPLSDDKFYLMGWRDAEATQQYKESMALKTPNWGHSWPLVR